MAIESVVSEKPREESVLRWEGSISSSKMKTEK